MADPNTQLHQTRILKQIAVDYSPHACSHSPDSDSIAVTFDHRGGSRWRSSTRFRHGTFGARIQCPKGNTSGLNFNLYLSSLEGDKSQDEIDFEFLGKDKTVVQTNYYASGIGNREALHDLGFDASDGFHDYVIKWCPNSIEWLIDGGLVRREERKEGEGFPEKPMFLYASVWDASYIAEGEWTGPYLGCHAPYICHYRDVRVPAMTEDGPNGVYYEGGNYRAIRVTSSVKMAELLEMLYGITGLDKTQVSIQIFCRYLYETDPKFYIRLPIVDDYSVSAMVDMYESPLSKLLCVQLFLVPFHKNALPSSRKRPNQTTTTTQAGQEVQDPTSTPSWGGHPVPPANVSASAPPRTNTSQPLNCFLQDIWVSRYVTIGKKCSELYRITTNVAARQWITDVLKLCISSLRDVKEEHRLKAILHERFGVAGHGLGNGPNRHVPTSGPPAASDVFGPLDEDEAESPFSGRAQNAQRKKRWEPGTCI